MKTNRALIAEVEVGWAAIRSRANAARRALDGCGPTPRRARDPPYLHPDSDTDAQIHEWGRRAREHLMERMKHGR